MGKSIVYYPEHFDLSCPVWVCPLLLCVRIYDLSFLESLHVPFAVVIPEKTLFPWMVLF